MVDELATAADRASAGGRGRFFGFVIGGALPPRWPPTGSPRCGTRTRASTSAAVGHRGRGSCASWRLDLLGLPPESSVGFVTGAQMANFTGLAAARERARRGRLGRRGRGPHRRAARTRHGRRERTSRSPRAAAARARRARRSSRDDQGRTARGAGEALGEDGPTIVCAQAGEVNTGAFDPLARSPTPATARRRLAPRRRRVRSLGRRSPRCGTSSRASSAPTRGRPTRTSG